jgi:long-subunit fatty acid transport protein
VSVFRRYRVSQDYANTSLFGTKVIDGGLGWRSVFAVALGTQYQATDRLTLRAGYLYNTNPIRDVATLFNVQAPGIITNTLTLGASYDVTEDITFSLVWMHGFRNSIEGPILQVTHSSVRLDARVDTLWAGVNIKFGRSQHKARVVAANSSAGDPVPPSTWSDPDFPAPPSMSAFPGPAAGSNADSSFPPLPVTGAQEAASSP